MFSIPLLVQVTAGPANGSRDSIPFGRLVGQLSESGGYFDTDNLISNESSYLHVIGSIKALGERGGAYLGVAPDKPWRAKINTRILAAVASLAMGLGCGGTEPSP
ncbi:MAG: hypothetical protein EXR94_07725 [Gemmatimonadetes bacterium]|nr:hypothetical protein [Gemmatimonadota bacterium]